jgi:hypothetical protein
MSLYEYIFAESAIGWIEELGYPVLPASRRSYPEPRRRFWPCTPNFGAQLPEFGCQLPESGLELPEFDRKSRLPGLPDLVAAVFACGG